MLLHFMGAVVSIKTVTSREFNQDVSRIKQATSNGPVFITVRGHPAHVLLTIEDYQRLSQTKENIIDLLAMSDTVDFEPVKLDQDLYRPADFN